MKGHRFVWNGAQRLRQTAEYRQAVQKIRAEVETHWHERLARSRSVKRFCLRLRMEREIGNRIRALTPQGALYLMEFEHEDDDDGGSHNGAV